MINNFNSLFLILQENLEVKNKMERNIGLLIMMNLKI